MRDRLSIYFRLALIGTVALGLPAADVVSAVATTPDNSFQNGARTHLVDSSTPPCDFSVVANPDFNSFRVSGSVPLAELLDRGTSTFNPITARRWSFCAADGNGDVVVVRESGDQGTAVAQAGQTVRIARLGVFEIFPPYSGKPPKGPEKTIGGSGPCEASVSGNTARIECTVPRFGK